MLQLSHQLLCVAISGGLGTLARYGTGLAAVSLFGSGYPYGTYIVNIAGCFLFGAASGLITAGTLPTEWKILILTGFLGGFTTFSAFAFENYLLLTQQRYVEFAVHCFGQNVLGIAAVVFGLYLVSFIPKPV